MNPMNTNNKTSTHAARPTARHRLRLSAAAAFATLLMSSSAFAVTWNCRPTEVYELGNRVHVRCQNAITLNGDSVVYGAISNADSGKASRFVSMAQAALLSGKTFRMSVPSSSASNTAGCGTGNCRTPSYYGLRN